MIITELNKNISREKLEYTYYSVLNGLLKLTQLELKVLAEFSKLNSNNTFSKDNRKLVASKLEISIFNLNNYIRTLKDKGIFILRNEVLEINPYVLIRNKDNNSFTIKININITE